MSRALHWHTIMLAVTGLALSAVPAVAGTVERAPTASEAWYRVSPLDNPDEPACATPAGCPARPAAPADPYPENTLHVGAVSGRPESATYVTFNRGDLPGGAPITGGTAFLPIADSDSGTNRPEAATITACLVTAPFQPVESGDPNQRPPIDCEAASAVAEFDAEATPPRFTVDLTPFGRKWSEGTPNNGIGLIVDPAADSQETWHVAFSSRDREAEGAAPPITATLSFPSGGDQAGVGGGTFAQPPPPSSDGDDATSSSFSSGGGGASTSSETSSSGLSAPAFERSQSGPRPAGSGEAPVTTPEPAPEVAAPAAPTSPDASAGAQADATQRVAAPTAAAAPGYAYPTVWLLPLVLLVGAGGLGRALTREVAVVPADAPRGLAGRLWKAFFPDEH